MQEFIAWFVELDATTTIIAGVFVGLVVSLLFYALYQALRYSVAARYLGALLILSAIAGNAFFLRSIQDVPVQVQVAAEGEKRPLDLSIEVKPEGVMITWRTDAPRAQFIRYRAVDTQEWKVVRDVNGYEEYAYHEFLIEDADPGKQYEFEIHDGNTVFSEYKKKPLEFRM